jgi:hypothetical protein
MTTLFKITNLAGGSTYGHGFTYPLPRGKRPGSWTPAVERVAACVRGYHLTAAPVQWWNGDCTRLWVAEGRGKMAPTPDGRKVAYESVRLLEEVTLEWPLLPLYPELRVLLAVMWQRTHKDNPKDQANLAGADLAGANLARADLAGAYNLTLPAEWKLNEYGRAVRVPAAASIS